MANVNEKRPNPVAAKAPEAPKAAEKQPEVAVKTEEPVLVAVGGDSVASVQASPAAVPEATVVAVEPVVLPESSEEKLVLVTPRDTIPSTRIGNKYYSFLKGVSVKVPTSVKQLLQEKGLL